MDGDGISRSNSQVKCRWVTAFQLPIPPLASHFIMSHNHTVVEARIRITTMLLPRKALRLNTVIKTKAMFPLYLYRAELVCAYSTHGQTVPSVCTWSEVTWASDEVAIGSNERVDPGSDLSSF